MPDFFDDRGFNEFYLKSAKSKDKERLLRDFYDAWIDYWGPYNTIRTQTKSWVKGAWKEAKAKKAIKEKLLYRKYTAATIDGLFKKFSEWIKISCK